MTLPGPVNADNIADITAAFIDNAPARPKIETLIEKLFENMRQNNHERDLARLTRLIEAPPTGFRLALALGERISEARNRDAFNEYARIRPRTLKLRAAMTPQPLKDMGLCDHALGLMAEGKNPLTDDGRPYDVNIDHIIERSLAGPLARQKTQDPLLPREYESLYLVNHQANLVIVPVDVHETKTWLKHAQDMGRGEPRWFLTLAPVAVHGATLPLCAPQPQGVGLSKPTVQSEIERLPYCAKKVAQAADAFNRAATRRPQMLQALDDLHDLLTSLAVATKGHAHLSMTFAKACRKEIWNLSVWLQSSSALKELVAAHPLEETLNALQQNALQAGYKKVLAA